MTSITSPDVSSSNHTLFNRLVINSGIAGVANAFVWFALTYWVFLETKSVIATSIIAGVFAVSNALSAFIFGNIVDHHKKKQVMIWSSIASLVFYLLGGVVYLSYPIEAFSSIGSRVLWLFIVVLMLGSVIGNLRNIALTTTVSLLLPPEEHDKANGKIGMMYGLSFSFTSVLSGLVIGYMDMRGALVITVGATVLVLLHLLTISLHETDPKDMHDEPKKINIKETIQVINSVPGLFALIFFTTFNNFLGGVFMALMDAYGLTLVSVQTWGILRGFLSFGFLLGGFLITKFGLGKNPLRRMFQINIITWTVCIFFTVQPSIILMAAGMLIWMICVPFVEASESTIIQKVVPFHKQGRVFGFAQSVESAASPVTAFLIGPIAQLVFIPFMTTGRGVELIGSWFGTGMGRGIALVFIVAGTIGLIVTLIAFSSKYYKILSKEYVEGTSPVDGEK